MRNTVDRARVVPCSVGGVAQKWVVKTRRSGVLAIHPIKETWSQIVAQVLDRAAIIKK